MLWGPVSVLLFLCLSLVSVQRAISAECYRTFSRDDFPACRLLSNTFALHWKLDDTNVTFGVDVDESVNGWVGLGVSVNGGMKGADMWIIQQTAAGEWSVRDTHSEDYDAPILDTSQDVSLVGKPVTNGGSIAAVLTRKIKLCDVSDLNIMPNTTMAYIWAHASKAGYHGSTARGSVLMKLSSSEPSEPLTDVSRRALLMPNFTVPSELNSYWCTNFKLPSDTKYHIVDALPNITSPLVHHMIIFACSMLPSQPLGQPYECSEMMPACAILHLAWAPGVGMWQAPDQAGLPLAEYYALQMHYNNPKGVVGQKDASGMTIGYTSKLRKHDLGVLTLGQRNLSIPAGVSKYTAAPAVCPSECTSKFKEPVNVVAHAFHMHGLGLSIKTQRLRDGVELVPLDYLDRYDYNHQHFADPRPGAEQIFPGDTLLTTCSYDSSKATNVTVYGERTEDEMCFDFVMYYPAQDINTCLPATPGVASCFNSAKFSQWVMKVAQEVNMTITNTTFNPSPTPATIPTTTPTSAGPPTTKASAPSNQQAPSGSPAPPSLPAQSQRDAWRAKFFMSALAEGFFTLYDAAAYEPTGYTALKPEDACPAFLSAKDDGGAAASKGGSTAKSAAGEGAGRGAVAGVLLVLTAAALMHL